MAILTNSGRVAMAIAVMAQPIHMAWGSGNSSWDTTPVAPTTDDTALVTEIGRRIATSAQYCVPDNSGSIVVPTGKFSVSGTPTKNLYLRFNFDFTDAPTSDIREVAVFIGTVVQTGLPGGQQYFTPGQVTNPGTLLVVERATKFTRSPSVRQSFEFVVTF